MNRLPEGTRVRTLVVIRGEERGYGRADVPRGAFGVVRGGDQHHVSVVIDGETDGTTYWPTEIEAVKPV
jgi:hypothetical protein